jgi:DNA-binding MarR family transcriptional regulator
MFKELNPLLHSELRLGIMSILISVESADFTYIRKQTGTTAGNLSVQIEKLKEAGYIDVTKSFKGKMPCTTCKITSQGIEAFQQYIEALQSYLHPQRNKTDE